MSENANISQEELNQLYEHIQTITSEKSVLKLVTTIMISLGRAPGLDNTVHTFLNLILENFPAANSALYYPIDSKMRYMDILGVEKSLDVIEDADVRTVFESKEFLNTEREYCIPLTDPPKTTRAKYWTIPLMSGSKVVGVLKLNEMLLADEDLRLQMQPFFNYAALVLKNEIENHSKLALMFNEARREKMLLEMFEQSMQMTDEQLFDSALDFAIHLTDSPIGILHVLSPDGKAIFHTSLSSEVIRQCGNTSFSMEHILSSSVWQKCFSSKSAVIVNDNFAEETPREKICGNIAISTFLCVPIVESGVSTILFGVGNRSEQYSNEDVVHIRLIGTELSRILKQRSAEKSLQESESMYRSLVAAMAEGVIFQSADGNVTTMNPAAESILGMTKEEVNRDFIGRKIFSVFREDGSILPLNEFPSTVCLATGEAQMSKIIGIQKGNGPLLMLSTNSQPLFVPGNTVPGAVVTTFHDITERKKTEREIRDLNADLEERVRSRTQELETAYTKLMKSEESSRQVIEQSSEGIYLIDVETKKIVLANNAFIKMLGYSHQEILEHTAYDIVDASEENVNRKIQTILENETTVAIDRKYKKKNGERILVRASASAMSYRNCITVCVVVYDITEEKRRQELLQESEEKFRLISENIADFIAMFTPEGDFLYTSPSFKLLGYEAEMFQGKNIFSYIHPDDHSTVKNIITSVEQTLAHYSIEFRFSREGKEWSNMEASFSLLINDAGARFLTVMRDVSERKKSEHQRNELVTELQKKNQEIEEALSRLTQMQEGLVQSEKMASIGQLTAGIAHEINNPLAFITSNINRFNEYYSDVRSLLANWMEYSTAISVNGNTGQKFAQLLTETKKADLEFVDGDFKNLMEHTLNGTVRIKRIVDQLRGFAHSAKSEFIRTDINQLVEETLMLVWNELKYKATVTKELEAATLVECTAGEAQQVLVNLFVNAAHAIEEKGEIRVKTFDIAQSVCIEIKDTGKGIPKENLKRIFDPFFTTKPVGKGTGLGLWIVSTIIQNHNGKIEVDSEVGKGTQFRITLPVTHIDPQKN